MDEVVTVADARRGLSEILRRYRENPASEPVVIGSRRRPEAVIVPFALHAPREAAPAASALDRLREQRDLIRRIARLNRLEDVSVFGSVARGEETPTSDLDLLVTPAADASLFDLAQFEVDMEQLSGRPVDAISRRALDPRRDAGILAEAVAL
ncbi:MAG: hypothetical protein DI534_03100 [Leifsonia xyli]|nr:MAG: hypothetical protein DI534_03100 [Leifsonia xyli]